MSDIVKRLREDEEMLRNGLQQNLNDAWHNHTMKYAAKDCAEAADYIDALEAEVERLANALLPFAKKSKAFDDAADEMGYARSDDLYKPRTSFTHAELRAARASLEQRLREAAVETENFREPGEFGDGATMRRERE